MPKWWHNWSWSARFLAMMLAYSAAALVTVKILSMAGFEIFDPTPPMVSAPFSRKECIQRHQRYYFDRNPDMIELSNDQIGIVARRCAIEETEYYNR